MLSRLFSECLIHARKQDNDPVIRLHSLETLSIVLRNILAKNFAGWEVMEILAGGIAESDKVFMVCYFRSQSRNHVVYQGTF